MICKQLRTVGWRIDFLNSLMVQFIENYQLLHIKKILPAQKFNVFNVMKNILIEPLSLMVNIF